MPEKIITSDIVDLTGSKFINYAMSVIKDRALSNAKDGLKPVHKRILYSMQASGNVFSGGFRKSARAVGDCMGQFHPHGDSSIYGALIGLAQSFAIRYPLIEVQGNKGSLDGDPPAAMRYTECKLSKIGTQMVQDMNKNVVDMGRNFDNTQDEPAYLPCGYLPNLLMNGTTGIAVGMASKMPPHNLTEILDATIYIIDSLLQSQEPLENEIFSIIKGPDFPLGGNIIGQDGINNYFRTGEGAITIRASYEIEEYSNGASSIIVTDIPYKILKSDMVKKIDDLRKNELKDYIKEVTDESSKEGIRVVIALKKDVNVQLALNTILKKTPMQTTFTVNNTCLVDNEPQKVTLADLLQQYLMQCIDVLTRTTQFDLDKAENRRHLVEGLLWAIDEKVIETVVEAIRRSKTVEESTNALKALNESLSEQQINYIVDIKLRQLTVDNQQKYLDEKKELDESIENYNAILTDQSCLFTLLRSKLEDIKEKYGDERRTFILNDAASVINEIDLIEEETLVITYSTEDLIKAVEEKEYRSTNRGAKGVKSTNAKEKDVIQTVLTVNSKDDLLFFTNKGRCHELKAYKIPKMSRTARGKSINNFLSLNEGEKVISVISTDLSQKDKSFALITRDGTIKKLEFTNLSARMTVTKVITFKEDDTLVSVLTVDENDDVIITTAGGYSIRFESSSVRPSGRAAMGVKGITLRQDDYVVDAVTVQEDAEVLTITELGLSKRTHINEYKSQNRGGKGVITHKLTQATGALVCATIVDSEDELFIATAKGQMLRIDAFSIRETSSKSAKGVKVANLAQDDYIVSVSKVKKEDDEETIEGSDE